MQKSVQPAFCKDVHLSDTPNLVALKSSGHGAMFVTVLSLSPAKVLLSLLSVRHPYR